MTDADKLIFAHDAMKSAKRRANDPAWRMLIRLIETVACCGYAAYATHTDRRVGLALALLMMADVGYWLIKVVTYNIRIDQWQRLTAGFFWEIPVNLQIAANEMYGGSDGELAAILCHQSHIPGDCPLCGAA